MTVGRTIVLPHFHPLPIQSQGTVVWLLFTDVAHEKHLPHSRSILSDTRKLIDMRPFSLDIGFCQLNESFGPSVLKTKRSNTAGHFIPICCGDCLGRRPLLKKMRQNFFYLFACRTIKHYTRDEAFPFIRPKRLLYKRIGTD